MAQETDQISDTDVCPGAQPVKCYQLCIFNTYKLLKMDNSFDWEAGINALKANAPEKIAGPGSDSILNCKDAMKTTDDKCKAALEVAECIYNDNPAVNMFF
ncbi:hypothetical protein JTB14_008522 [Gonioctena quinquepunctata]|nr:hypothetical protein JTB14_008522 [Gonioctena quinquepunctata]